MFNGAKFLRGNCAENDLFWDGREFFEEKEISCSKRLSNLGHFSQIHTGATSPIALTFRGCLSLR